MERPDYYSTVLAIFDNGGETIDRYTVVLGTGQVSDTDYNRDMLALGDDVTSPQGFSQYTYGEFNPSKDNSHLGKEIRWEDLPETHQKHIIWRIKEEGVLTSEELERQDFVDTAIEILFCSVLENTPHHNIEHIGRVRDGLKTIIVDEMKVMDEQEFYPFIKE